MTKESDLNEERIALILKIVEWAQRKGIKVQDMNAEHLKKAIRCKF